MSRPASGSKALITGGAGFIGSHLAELLLDDGWEVFALDDLSTGSIQNVASLRDNRSFHLVVDSVLSPSIVNELVYKCDVVYHLAAAVGVRLIVEQPVHTLVTNIQGTETVLEYCNRFGKRALVASTSEVYGYPSEEAPFVEDARRVYGATTQRRWAYSESKAMDEFMALAYHQERGLDCVIARLFNTVGPRQSGQYGMVIPRFVQSALAGRPLEIHGDGTQSRCFCHVSDTIRALRGLMDEPATAGEIYNVGSTESIRILDLAAKVKQLTQSRSDLAFVPYDQVYGQGIEDVAHRRPAIEKIRAAIGWRPSLDLDRILGDVVDWAKRAPTPVELPDALVAGREFVQIPNAERPRLLVTLDDKAVRFALEHLGRETTAWRLARVMGRLGLGRALLAARFPVGVVTQHVGATPLLDELQRVTGEPGSFVVQVGREGDLLVHLLRGDTAAAVAKVSRDTVRLECEALALRDVGELARSAGADVPRPLAQHELNGVAVLVETAVRGRPLAWTLAGARRRLRPGLEAVAEWLAAWHHLTAAPARLTRDLLEAELLGPAGVVAAAIDDGDAYLRVLADAGARAEGAAVSLVAAHWDLTSSNVLAEGRRLGIVDWEHARTDSLPLTDFVYAAADLVSAVGRHEDRVGSFESCFAPGGRWAELVAGLERRLRDAVGISEIVAEVCFHACWARHASNELRASRGRPGEFVALARRAAELRR